MIDVFDMAAVNLNVELVLELRIKVLYFTSLVRLLDQSFALLWPVRHLYKLFL